MTRDQHNSPIWQRQRQGRITATVAHDIISLKPETSKTNVLKKIMKYSQKDLSNVEAIKFGLRHEGKAKATYISEMQTKHENFSTTECGLFVDCTFPIFAATPDGMRTCACHGDGLVEIKCSFKHKDSNIHEICDPSFYLDENMELKKSHRYYTQVQFQMYVCGKQFCDFVVFTNKDVLTTTVYYDADFVNQMVGKCVKFALEDLVPEIIQHKLQT